MINIRKYSPGRHKPGGNKKENVTRICVGNNYLHWQTYNTNLLVVLPLPLNYFGPGELFDEIYMIEICVYHKTWSRFDFSTCFSVHCLSSDNDLPGSELNE